MKGFPHNPDFLGLNEPVGIECSLEKLKVEGKIPKDVHGAFFRAVPDPAFPPIFEDDTAISGDGMISKLHFHGDGSVDFAIRFVQTERHKAEVKAGKALFGKYRNPYTDDPSVRGVDRTVSNTTPVWHAGRLLMTKEDGHPYAVDPLTLDTLGSFDFGGKLKSETMTAHVRVDPESGEMFFYGYEADGLASTKVAYCIADVNGNLVREQWFDVPYCGLMHDFAISENYALFPVFPTTADLERIKAGGAHWVHESSRESWLGVMPRYGDVSEMRWFKGPKGVSVFHMMNAFEDAEGQVNLDQHLTPTNVFPFIQRASGIEVPPDEIGGALVRWSVDMQGKDEEITQTEFGPPGDLPRIADADLGREYSRGWYLSMNPEAKGPPVFGGVVGAMFNLLICIDPTTGKMQTLPVPPAHGISEPVHIPAAKAGHEGWLVSIVDNQTGDNDFEHSAWIIDAGDIAAGPVAKVEIPHRLRPQVHGWWVPQSKLPETSGSA
jgi:carotenoid cleavage dioxygenase-like enzyme